MFEQRLKLLASEQFGSVGADDLGEMRTDDRNRVERQRAGRLRALAFFRHNRFRAKAVDGLETRFALDLRQHRIGRHREQTIQAQPAFASMLRSCPRMRVGVRRARNPSSRSCAEDHDDPCLRRERPAHVADAIQQRVGVGRR